MVSPDRYHLSIDFKHNNSLVVPTSSSNCDPGKMEIAPDGKPYLMAREHLYIWNSESVYEVLGFRSMSMDWMSCGHPPVGKFTTPHYDMHFYHLDESERKQLGCSESPPAPVCSKKSQPAFYVPLENNLLPKFEMDQNSAVPRSGIHWYNFGLIPISTSDWITPITIEGSYYGNLTFWEIMTPLNFRGMSSYSENLVYTNQSDFRLPTRYNIIWKSNNDINIGIDGNNYQLVNCISCQRWGGSYRNGKCLITEIPMNIECYSDSIYKKIVLGIMIIFFIILGFYILLRFPLKNTKMPSHIITQSRLETELGGI